MTAQPNLRRNHTIKLSNDMNIIHQDLAIKQRKDKKEEKKKKCRCETVSLNNSKLF